MMKVSPRLGESPPMGGGTAVRASSARSITIVFQRTSECLSSSPRGDEAAMPSSASAAAAWVILLNVFILVFLSLFLFLSSVPSTAAKFSASDDTSPGREQRLLLRRRRFGAS